MTLDHDTRCQARFTSKLVLGLALIALGAAMLLHNTHILDLDVTGRWWPLVLVAFGVERLVVRGFLQSTAGHALLLGGTGLLLACLDRHAWLERWWPVGLLWMGSLLVLRAVLRHRAHRKTEAETLCQDEKGRL